MMFIGMFINAMAISQAAPPEPSQTPGGADSGFAAAMGQATTARSGAPPGPEPPPAMAQAGEEVAKPGPNARSQNPDFPPQKSTASKKTTIATCVQVTGVPSLLAGVVSQVPISTGSTLPLTTVVATSSN